MSTYVDTNVFFLAAFGDESNPKTQKAKEIILRMSEGKEIFYTSLITVDELIWAAMKQKIDRTTAIEQGMLLHQLPIKFVPLITSISLKSLNLMRAYKIRPRDALHAASCMEVKANSLVTDDADFDEIKEVRRISLA